MKQKQKQSSHIQTKEEAMEQEHAQTSKYEALEIKGIKTKIKIQLSETFP